MPQYLYENPKTGEVIEVFQSMKDEHVYFDKNGLEWKRVFTSPQASIDTKWDDMNSRDFVEKTRNKKGSLGDLWSQSQELSAKREKRMGKDFNKEKWMDRERNKRRGKKLACEVMEARKKLSEGTLEI